MAFSPGWAGWTGGPGKPAYGRVCGEMLKQEERVNEAFWKLTLSRQVVRCLEAGCLCPGRREAATPVTAAELQELRRPLLWACGGGPWDAQLFSIRPVTSEEQNFLKMLAVSWIDKWPSVGVFVLSSLLFYLGT